MAIMNCLLVLLVVVGCALGQGRYRPQPVPGSGQHIRILRQQSDINPDGSYSWSYEAENGISAQEQGAVKGGRGPEGEALEAQGSFQYTAPDGTPVTLQYIANENGFQPQGSHVPQIPPAIQRALAWNAAHPEQDDQRYNKF